ncbi:MAG: sugar phosphate nucleotidyltransferase, partial [bacterium]|nr:sugar phosphate nucleotidyltransferase [bacterium]
MQVVILAAGVGKRLRPLTEDVPKPIVRVGDRPILEYTLSILPEVIDEVILV